MNEGLSEIPTGGLFRDFVGVCRACGFPVCDFFVEVFGQVEVFRSHHARPNAEPLHFWAHGFGVVIMQRNSHSYSCLRKNIEVLVYLGLGVFIGVFQEVCFFVELLRADLLDMGI